MPEVVIIITIVVSAFIIGFGIFTFIKGSKLDVSKQMDSMMKNYDTIMNNAKQLSQKYNFDMNDAINGKVVCAHCGAVVEADKKCPNCGAVVKKD